MPKYGTMVLIESRACIECNELIPVDKDDMRWVVSRDGGDPLCRVCAETEAPAAQREADNMDEMQRSAIARADSRATARATAVTPPPDESDFRIGYVDRGRLECPVCRKTFTVLSDRAGVVTATEADACELCDECSTRLAPKLAAQAKGMLSLNKLAILAGRTPA